MWGKRGRGKGGRSRKKGGEWEVVHRIYYLHPRSDRFRVAGRKGWLVQRRPPIASIALRLTTTLTSRARARAGRRSPDCSEGGRLGRNKAQTKEHRHTAYLVLYLGEYSPLRPRYRWRLTSLHSHGRRAPPCSSHGFDTRPRQRPTGLWVPKELRLWSCLFDGLTAPRLCREGLEAWTQRLLLPLPVPQRADDRCVAYSGMGEEERGVGTGGQTESSSVTSREEGKGRDGGVWVVCAFSLVSVSGCCLRSFVRSRFDVIASGCGSRPGSRFEPRLHRARTYFFPSVILCAH